MRLGHATDAGRRGMPPLLVEQEGLGQEIEGRLLPGGVGKAPVLRQRLDSGSRVGIASATPHVIEQAQIFSAHFRGQLHLLAGR